MADNPESNTQTNTLFNKLKKMFSSDVIVRNVGGKKLKIIDTDSVEFATDKNSLRDRYNRLRSSTYNLHNRDMSLAYQAARLELFRDYDVMDADPILSSALDVYSEESVTPNEFGNILTITSSDENIKKILENLFNDILNIEFNLHSWARSLAKYGDFFLRMDISPEYGVYLVKPLSAYEITRVEGSDPKNINYVKFQHDGLGGGQEYENFEMAHFRLMSDSNFMPYGKCLTKNSYVETMYGAKRITDISVGEKVWTFNIDKKVFELSDVLHTVSSGVKEIVKVSTQHNQIECSKNHPILTFNGSELVYKTAECVSVNDMLVLSNNKYKKTTDVKLDKSLMTENNHNGWKNNIDLLPDYVDETFAEFFGFMLGDGWLDKKLSRVSFATGIHVDLNDKYSGILSKYTGKEVKVIEPRENSGGQRYVDSKILAEFLASNGFRGNSHEKRIPTWVYELTEYLQLKFIRGLVDSDGSVVTDKWNCNRYAIELNNKSMVEDAKHLLGRLNIKCSNVKCRGYDGETEICGVKCNRTKSYYIYFYLDGSTKSQQKKYDFLKNDEVILVPITKIETVEDQETFDIQVASGNSNFIANGIIVHNSMLEPARRIWKQLSLAEDAMLIHRIVRAPEKRIFKVDVGNIPPVEVDGYIEKLMNKAKKVPYIDERTGDYNLRYNLNNMLEDFWLPVRGGDSGTSIDTLPGMEFTGIEDLEYLRNKMMAALKIPKAFLGYDEAMCLALDTKIPLLNGTDKTLTELIDEHSRGIKNYVYSIDETTKLIVPGEITWAGITRRNTSTVKIWLDNGECVQSTPDHLFLTRDGKWIAAEKLEINQSLMPLYKKNEIMYKKSDYEMVYQPGTDNWQWTHRMVESHNPISPPIRGTVIHHVDFNRKNNNPSNLERMTWVDHREIHMKNVYKTMCSPAATLYKKSAEFSAKKSAERLKYINANPQEVVRLKNNLAQYTMSREELSTACTTGWKNSQQSRLDKLTETNKKYNKQSIMQKAARMCRGFTAPLPTMVELKTHIQSTAADNLSDIAIKLNCGSRFLSKLLHENGYSNAYELFNEILGFKSGRPASVTHDLYMKLVSECGSVDGVAEQYKLSKKQRVTFYKSKPLNHKVVKIEHCTELIDTGDITVAEHHNFATCVGVIVHNSGKSTLAMEDLRFARTIGRIQRIIVSELTKIAIVHLFVQGYSDASLVDFDLKLSNPSTVFEQEKIQIWQDKVNLAKDMMESNSFSRKWLYEKLWGMSDDEVASIKSEIIEDKKQEWRVEQITAEGNDPMTSNQKVGADGEMSDTGGDTGDGDMGGDLPDMGGDAGGADASGDVPDLPELTESDDPEEPTTRKEKDDRNDKRDQTGEKKNSDFARKHPFGEDHMGKSGIGVDSIIPRNCRTTLPHPVRENNRSNKITLASMSEDLKSIKKTLGQRKMIKNQKSVISETTSMLDEANLIDDAKIE